MTKSSDKLQFFTLFQAWLDESNTSGEYREILAELEKEGFFERCELMAITHACSNAEIMSKVQVELEQTSLGSYDRIRILKAIRDCIEQRLGISYLYQRKRKAPKKAWKIPIEDRRIVFEKLRRNSERDALILEIYLHIDDSIAELTKVRSVSLERILSVSGKDVDLKKCTLNIGDSKFLLPVPLVERLKKMKLSPEELVFATSRGKRIDPRQLRRSLSRAGKATRQLKRSLAKLGKVVVFPDASCLSIRRPRS